jgi:uncharacterized protein YnzC (UPF0291/DUF896 family)
MITDEQVARINQLAKLAKERTLTPEETTERAELRKAYIDAVKVNLQSTLQNIEIVD